MPMAQTGEATAADWTSVPVKREEAVHAITLRIRLWHNTTTTVYEQRQSEPAPVRDLNTDPPQPQSTVCGDIVYANQYLGYDWFLASAAIECLLSVPFNSAVATRFISYYNQTLQFQSTSAYLKQPPAGYQQPPVDIFGDLRQIQNKVDSGFYRNQYAFEADLQALSQATHDAHTTLYAGVSNQFTFAAPFYLVSVSVDGKQAPQVYIYDDIIPCVNSTACNATAVTTINGVATTRYLADFASHQSFGMVEPNADFNQLMSSPAQEIIGSANAFSGGATFYPGDTMNIGYADGKNETFDWLAIYNSPGFTGPLETGGDFHNFFALGIPPANFNETYTAYQSSLASNATGAYADNGTTDGNCSSPLTSWNCVSSAYPADPISFQQNLGIDSSGFVTGYYLADVETAVISIPSFVEYGDGIGTFSQAIIDFVGNATARNATKLIIDLQQNSGGQESLAFEVFRQFFPNTAPYTGSRMRSHYLAYLLGEASTSYFDTLEPSSDEYDSLVGSEWVVTDRIDAQTQQNFTSWAAFYGPAGSYNGDPYTQTEQYNLSSEVFDNDALGMDYPACYYNSTCNSAPAWAGSDIILLTDGLCDSSCSLFVELMTQIVGVHTVTVGGRPDPGPMQIASGSRGASAYSSDLLDYDVSIVSVEDTVDNTTLSGAYDTDTGMHIYYAGVNLRDQIRANSTIPNQFLYLPSECRIYWSMANWYDSKRLWHDTWNAIYNDTSLCVAGSTNATTPPPPFSSSTTPPSRRRNAAPLSTPEYIAHGLSLVALAPTSSNSKTPGIFDDTHAPPPVTFCDSGPGTKGNSAKCGGLSCQPVKFACAGSGGPRVTRSICSASCQLTSNQGGFCSGFESCRVDASANSKKNSVSGLAAKSNSHAQYSVQSGHCLPSARGQGQYQVLRGLGAVVLVLHRGFPHALQFGLLARDEFVGLLRPHDELAPLQFLSPCVPDCARDAAGHAFAGGRAQALPKDLILAEVERPGRQ
ncbi:hypothetical protein B0A54_07798 [Friedmanniomyces endolithicus]|uniref:Uncharacterized protein n=1 Tax=Friedmanniomyces endolithicus TaxID=329885 RepID=A0A4U0UZV9_9PEZI|nr:hypothetical protein B0A54_07798 [Friedmanniomyces endolithicus]